MTALPSKKERVRSYFFLFLSCLASTISMRIFCHRRAQEDRSDDIGVVWGVSHSGNSVEKKMGRITSHLLLVRTDGARQERDEGGDDGRIAPRCRRLDGDIPTGREATEQT